MVRIIGRQLTNLRVILHRIRFHPQGQRLLIWIGICLSLSLLNSVVVVQASPRADTQPLFQVPEQTETPPASTTEDTVIADVRQILLNQETGNFDIDLTLQGMSQVARYAVSFVQDETVVARYAIEGPPEVRIHIPTTDLAEGRYDIIVRTFSIDDVVLSEYRGQITYTPLFAASAVANPVVVLLPVILVGLLGLTLIILAIRLRNRDRTQRIIMTLPPAPVPSHTPTPSNLNEDAGAFIDQRPSIPKAYQAIIYVDRTEAELGYATFVVDKSPFRLGRRKNPPPALAPDINFYNDRDVSRDHAEIVFDRLTKTYSITDNSSNGTFVGEDAQGQPLKKLKSRQTERLNVSAQKKVRVQLGKTTVFYMQLNDASTNQ